MTEGPTDDELAEALRRRDRGFLFRLALRVGVVILLGVYLSLAFDGQEMGGCAARSFGALTGSTAAAP